MSKSTTKPGNLTPKQKKVLDFVTSFYEKAGYAPSLSEIAKRFKKSTILRVWQRT